MRQMNEEKDAVLIVTYISGAGLIDRFLSVGIRKAKALSAE